MSRNISKSIGKCIDDIFLESIDIGDSFDISAFVMPK